MAIQENAPFPRGQTLFGIGAGGSISSVTAATVLSDYGHLIGRTFQFRDPDYQGKIVTLMVAQYDGSGNLTADARFVDFTDGMNTIFSDLAPGAGTVAYPLDHKYEGKTIKDGDLCYVVVDGPCEVEFLAALNVGDNIATDTAGKAVASQAGDQFAAGYAVDAGSTNTNATIMVGQARGLE